MKGIRRLGIVLLVLLAGLFSTAQILFAQQEHGGKEHAGAAPVQPAAPAPVPSGAPTPETVLLDDDLPANSKEEGNWVWDTSTVASGLKSHGHPPAKGLQSHGFATGEPITLSANGMLSQQVWLDPADPPKGLMLKFKTAAGDEVGVYWEGEETVFNPGEEEELWYYGYLPELGKWSPLEVLVEDLALEEEKITGISFTTFDGKALWDKTVLTQAPPAEELEAFPETPTLAPTAPSPEE